MPVSRHKPKNPQILLPVDYNIGTRADMYRVIAVPLVPAAPTSHPFYNQKQFDITRYIEQFQWSSDKDEAGVVKGSASIRNPGNILGILVPGSKLILKQATQLQTGVGAAQRRKQRFVKVLELIIQDRDKDQVEFILNVDMADRLFYLSQGSYSFNYAPKKHKKGKTASEIILAECKKRLIPTKGPSREVGVPKTKVALEKISDNNVSVLQFFVDVLKAHNKRVDKMNGKHPAPPNWDINMRKGYLEIRPHKAPKRAWLINERDFMGKPSYQESTKDLATRVTVKAKHVTHRTKHNKDGSVSKRKKAVKKNISVSVDDASMIRAYGLIEHVEKISGSITVERARQIARSVLNKKARLLRTFSFSCPALPGIWVGSKVYLNCPTYGMRGFFTVTSIQYTLGGEEAAAMDVTVDAGSRELSQDAIPPLIAILKTRFDKSFSGIPAGRVARVTWTDGHHEDYSRKGPNGHYLRIKSVDRHPASETPVALLGKVGETATIHFTNGSKMTVPNRFKWPQGLTVTTQEGYIPASMLEGGNG